MPDEPEKSYEERRARYEVFWRTYYIPLGDSPEIRTWTEVLLAIKVARAGVPPESPELPGPGTWRDRPPLL